MSQRRSVLVLSNLRLDPVGAAVQRALVAELEARGFSADLVDLAVSRMEVCNSCGACGLPRPGVCPFQDELKDLGSRLSRSVACVVAAPAEADRRGLVRALSRCHSLSRCPPIFGVVLGHETEGVDAWLRAERKRLGARGQTASVLDEHGLAGLVIRVGR